MGFEADWILSMSEKNCARYSNIVSGKMKEISSVLDLAFSESYPEVWAEMSQKDVSGEEMCDYVSWAYFNAVPLQGDEARQAIYTEMATSFCPQKYYDEVT